MPKTHTTAQAVTGNLVIQGGPGMPGIRTLVEAPEYHYDPNDLFARYGSLVDQVLKTFGRTHDPVTSKDDLRQEGAIGLLAAARTYDPTRGANFRTYARTCVENAMLGAIRKTRKGAKGYSQSAGNEHIEYQVKPAINNFYTGFKETHMDRTIPTTEEKIIHKEEEEAIREAMAGLPQKQQQIIVLRLIEMRSNQESANILGISAGRASQIWATALNNLEKILLESHY